MIDCRDCRERLNDLLEDEFASIEASTRAELRAHLDNCAECTRELEFMRAIRDDLRSFGAVEAPSNLRVQVRSHLIGEKSASAKAKTPFWGFRPTRLALSGGALLAACCLLLVVRSSQYQESFSLAPNDKDSASPTQKNFDVPAAAFKDSPDAKLVMGGARATKESETAPKMKTGAVSQAKPATSMPRIQNPAPRSETDNSSKTRKELVAKADKTLADSKATPDIGKPIQGTPDSVGKGNRGTPMDSVPTPSLALHGGVKDDIHSPTETQPNRVEKPQIGPYSAAKGDKGDAGPLSDAGPGDFKGPQEATQGASLADNVGIAASNNAVAGREGLKGAGHGAPAALAAGAAPLPVQPPTLMRNQSRTANGIGSPKMVMVRRPDYYIPLNAAQTFKLSFVPQQDVALAQIRLTLPDGLQFADTPKTNEKTEPSRILWRGAAQNGVAIENDVELKAISNGFKKTMLTLESAEGLNLQTKVVAFQVQEPTPAESPKAPPAAEEK